MRTNNAENPQKTPKHQIQTSTAAKLQLLYKSGNISSHHLQKAVHIKARYKLWFAVGKKVLGYSATDSNSVKSKRWKCQVMNDVFQAEADTQPIIYCCE